MDRILTLRALQPLPLDLRQKIFETVLESLEKECKDWLEARSPILPGDTVFEETCKELDAFLVRFAHGQEKETEKLIEWHLAASVRVYYIVPSDIRWIQLRCALLGLMCQSINLEYECQLLISKPRGWDLDLNPDTPPVALWDFGDSSHLYPCHRCGGIYRGERFKVGWRSGRLYCDSCNPEEGSWWR